MCKNGSKVRMECLTESSATSELSSQDFFPVLRWSQSQQNRNKTSMKKQNTKGQ